MSWIIFFVLGASAELVALEALRSNRELASLRILGTTSVAMGITVLFIMPAMDIWRRAVNPQLAALRMVKPGMRFRIWRQRIRIAKLIEWNDRRLEDARKREPILQAAEREIRRGMRENAKGMRKAREYLTGVELGSEVRKDHEEYLKKAKGWHADAKSELAGLREVLSLRQGLEMSRVELERIRDQAQEIRSDLRGVPGKARELADRAARSDAMMAAVITGDRRDPPRAMGPVDDPATAEENTPGSPQ
ncbi:hypothetical protein [Enemella evansiae]|uniref:hypothetical protein n=1 Tax=Enemella evansiae TaxID=2016499 RepID=UPI001595B947|nr:hypothetical protein [Enemella evansiae]